MPTGTCQICGASFKRSPSHLQGTKGKYCSRACADTGQRGGTPIAFEVDAKGCHICVSHRRNGRGYPLSKSRGTKVQVAKRIYEEAHGPIPEGLVVRHKCDTPTCINLAHLELGTNWDNSRDCMLRLRAWSKLTPDQVLSIRGDTRKTGALAALYGVTTQTIRNVRRGRTWRQLLPGFAEAK